MHHQTFPAAFFSLVLFHSQNLFYLQIGKKEGEEVGEAVCGTPKPCTSFCLCLVFLCVSHLERDSVPMHGFGLESTFSSFAPSERRTRALVGLQQVSLLKQRA